jgi:ATP-dependent helicase/nuclease subunit A
MGIPKSLSPAALLGQLAAVRQWLHTRWPKATLVVEVPITQSLAGGQLMNGRIDLLMKTDQGWILFDHRSGSQNSTAGEARSRSRWSISRVQRSD